MKIFMQTMLAALAIVPALAQAIPPYEGATFDVLVYDERTRSPARTCVHFDRSGRFTLASEPLSMRWAAQADDESAFIAVTEPGDRVVVPYHMAVHGSLTADGIFVAEGIDEFGATFAMRGTATAACTSGDSNRPAIGARSPSPIDLGQNPVLIGKPWFRDRCYAPPGWAVICDPVPNPLAYRADDSGTSSLAGRSFRLTLGSSGVRTRDYCWAFGDDGRIESATTGPLSWAPQDNTRGGFASVGAGSRAIGIGYHGELVDENLLRVTGMEARSGRSVVTYGYGLAVDACD